MSEVVKIREDVVLSPVSVVTRALNRAEFKTCRAAVIMTLGDDDKWNCEWSRMTLSDLVFALKSLERKVNELLDEASD